MMCKFCREKDGVNVKDFKYCPFCGRRVETLQGNSLILFVEGYCVVDNYIDTKNRLNLKVFKENYREYCNRNNVKNPIVSHKDINYFLGKKYGTKIVKSSTYFISNIKMSDNFEKDYGFGG